MRIRTIAATAGSVILLTACATTADTKQAPTPAFDQARIDAALDRQSDGAKARYGARHPAETLAFFDLAPGMTVVEGLPGGGWYSKILVDYLGPDGRLIGADYALDMWPKFGFFDDEFIEGKKTWASDWPEQAQEWRGADSARVDAFAFNAVPERLLESADAVVFIRALHNFARFNEDGGYLDNALAETYAVLKPGGIVGVVQHQAPEARSDAFANGSRGYLKKAYVIERMRAAGFEYVGSRDINANPKDQPSEADMVWRLPPSLSGSRDKPEQRAKMEAIGESNRMTLKFRKPR
ncbi:MAG: methyltransferase, partial [Pseudomonadota bacterium]